MSTAVLDNVSVIRTRDAVLVGAVVVLLVGLLVITGLLMARGGMAPTEIMVPAALADQSAPAQTSMVRGARAVGDPLQASAAWVARTSQASGISSIAVTAYGNATLRIAKEDPSCHLGWTTLAGIGTIESGNGTFGGSHLLPNGETSLAINGPALNGAGGNAAIGNGSGGWSSGMGPMQFIQSTWNRWGAGGDVNNIFDAALAAGRYLCADGKDLSTASGWTAAIFSYNHDVTYVQNVYAAANAAAGDNS